MSGTSRSTTLTFGYTMPYAAAVVAGVRAGVGDRPYAWLQVINPVTLVASRREFGLIDSRCDQCFLDRGLLAGLGLTTHSSTVVVAGGGTVAVDIALNAEIEIEGVVVSGVPLTFGPATVSLIGRDIYLRAFELAFRTNDWLHA